MIIIMYVNTTAVRNHIESIVVLPSNIDYRIVRREYMSQEQSLGRRIDRHVIIDYPALNCNMQCTFQFGKVNI